MGRAWISVGLGVALVAGACGNSEPEVVLTDPSTTTSEAPATSAADSTVTTVTTTVAATAETAPPTTGPDNTVGDLVAYEAQIDAVYDFLGTEAAPRAEVPFPDVTNPDPLVAFESMLQFHYWMVSTNPWRTWVSLYALDDSPYAVDRRSQASRYSAPPSLMTWEAEPFTVGDMAVVPVADLDPPSHVLDVITAGAVGIEFTSSSSRITVVDREDGTIHEEYDAWVGLVSHAIVEPTGAGWRIAFIRWSD